MVSLTIWLGRCPFHPGHSFCLIEGDIIPNKSEDTVPQSKLCAWLHRLVKGVFDDTSRYNRASKNKYFMMTLIWVSVLVQHLPPRSPSQAKSSRLRIFIKLHWNTATVARLHIIYGCLHTTEAELSSHAETTWPTKLEIFTIWSFIYRKLFADFCVRYYSKCSTDTP